MRVLLILKLRQQGIDGLLVFRRQPAILQNLLNLALDIRLIQRRKHRGRDINQLELRGLDKAHIAQQGVIYLIGLNIKHDLGPGQVQVADEIGGGIEGKARGAYRNS